MASVSRRHPNFFIVGASRAGTTSLYRYLQQHPDIFMPNSRHGLSEKEPSFFCDLTPPWATAFRDYETYLSLFADAGDARAVGEASTTYLVSPESPMRIRDVYPEARIIVVLRHPADRAFSLHQYLCSLGVEWVVPFEKALEVEAQRRDDDDFRRNNPFWYYAYLYFHSGLYWEQLSRFMNVFPRERIHIVLFDDLKANPLDTTRRVYDFLGVDPRYSPNLEVHNQSRSFLSVRLHYATMRMLRGHLPQRRVARGMVAIPVALLTYANVALGRFRHRAMSPGTRRTLVARYQQDIRRTAALIGRDLNSWLATDGSQR